jgi:hypothetical protein
MTTRIDQDGSLVVALRCGDPTAAEDLVAVYGGRACRLAMRITRNAPDAEEAVQDAFLSVIRKIDSFRGDATFGVGVPDRRERGLSMLQKASPPRGRRLAGQLASRVRWTWSARRPGHRLVDDRRRPGSPYGATDGVQQRH